MKLSVIVPSRNERFMPETVNDLLAKAAGDIEVILVCDGGVPERMPAEDPRLQVIYHSSPLGLRACDNDGAAVATGDYLMKSDAHCMFAPGFDEVLKADCDGDWVVIPRRKRLNAEDWCIADPERQPIDYHYFNCPWINPDYFNFSSLIWGRRTSERLHIPIDETMDFQGSCWFMSRQHWARIGGVPEMGYGGFSQEPEQIGLTTWLGGGRVMVNKKTWYAHLRKGSRYGRGYAMSGNVNRRGHEWSARYWTENRWQYRLHDFDWLVDHFWPVPNWPADWKRYYRP